MPSHGTGAMLPGKHALVGIYNFVLDFCCFYVWCIMFCSFIITRQDLCLCECPLFMFFNIISNGITLNSLLRLQSI